MAACVGYEAVRGLGLALGKVNLPTWQILPADLKAAHRLAVRRVLGGETEPHVIHQEWVRQKLEEGWRRGREYDYARREHPHLAPWVELPEDNRMEYKIFIAVVRAFAE